MPGNPRSRGAWTPLPSNTVNLFKCFPKQPRRPFRPRPGAGTTGQTAEAREEFSEALRLKPIYPEADRELQKLGGIRIMKQ
jgi:hypothetical protein